MSLGLMNRNSVIVRRITVEGDVVTVDDTTDHGAVYVGLTPPDDAPTPGEAPRDAPAAVLRHSSGLLGPRAPLRAGDRLDVGGEVWEILNNGKGLRAGSRVIAHDFAALKVDDLYPVLADLTEMGGEVIVPMRLAIWSPTETREEQGTYDNYEAECPPEFRDELKRNRVIVTTGGSRYKIAATMPEADPPRVRMTLRRTDG